MLKENVFKAILKFLSNRMLRYISGKLISSIISTRLNDHVKSFLICDVLEIVKISGIRLVHMKGISETGSHYDIMISEMNVLYMISNKKINEKYPVYVKKIDE